MPTPDYAAVPLKSPSTYSFAEEVANCITHGLGACLSIIGLILLLTVGSLEADPWKTFSFAVYGSSLILLYLASTLYHGFQQPALKRIFKLLDHCAIYLLIAGTYTPFLLVNMRGPVGWTLFAIIWTLALGGVFFKLVFGSRYPILSVTTYLLMGWLIIFASSEMAEKISQEGITLIAAGGITYSVGVIFYLLKRMPYAHSIWHLFVLGGSTCHFLAVYWHVLPTQTVV